MCFQTETGMLGPQYKPYRPNPRPWLVVIEVSTIHSKGWKYLQNLSLNMTQSVKLTQHVALYLSVR